MSIILKHGGTSLTINLEWAFVLSLVTLVAAVPLA